MPFHAIPVYSLLLETTFPAVKYRQGGGREHPRARSLEPGAHLTEGWLRVGSQGLES